MRDLELPDAIASLIDELQVVQVTWLGIPLQLPKFAVYSIVPNPVFDRHFYRNGRRMAMVRLGRYEVPVIDPFRGHIDQPPKYLVIITHSKENRFGLYAYPADHVEDNVQVPKYHRSVRRIVQDFI
ncbi:hypothetical protein [Aliiglaciecola sp. LCG003]|uniref:hypothetical protein n=1 Tax=Aliiglaciecola sp. LCG003 TaxID=3053655 RepID=UPI002572E7A8|nr:hypothetical protein [Aliiglaciecola sp. LCG003]WJG08974.1 hypothetical protein QR722_16830 [Aliiglaciecola sp. LCG003]